LVHPSHLQQDRHTLWNLLTPHTAVLWLECECSLTDV
jgi:hypothetical protein